MSSLRLSARLIIMLVNLFTKKIESENWLCFASEDFLSYVEQSLNTAEICAVDQTGVGEVAFLFLSLFSQDVAFESVFSLDFS